MTLRGTALQSTSALTSALNWSFAIICLVADSAARRASLRSNTSITQLPYSAMNNRGRFYRHSYPRRSRASRQIAMTSKATVPHQHPIAAIHASSAISFLL
jgi:hypothetical protein